MSKARPGHLKRLRAGLQEERQRVVVKRQEPVWHRAAVGKRAARRRQVLPGEAKPGPHHVEGLEHRRWARLQVGRPLELTAVHLPVPHPLARLAGRARQEAAAGRRTLPVAAGR